MDTALVAGILTIAGTTATGLVSLAGLLVKRHLAFLSKLETNDDAKTASLGTIATELTRTREVQQTHAGRLDSLEKTIGDKRQEDATAASKAATAALLKAEAIVTGKHAAVDVVRLEISDEDSVEGPRSDPRRHRPRSS